MLLHEAQDEPVAVGDLLAGAQGAFGAQGREDGVLVLDGGGEGGFVGERALDDLGSLEVSTDI